MASLLVAVHLICISLMASGFVLDEGISTTTDNPISHGNDSSLDLDGPVQISPRDSDDERIVGGVRAAPHSRPWQVLLMTSDGYLCGGTVIDAQWVLTAAHCIPQKASVTVTAVAGMNERCIDTSAGRVTKYGDGAEIRKVARIVQPGYSSVGNKNDIAMYKLSSPYPLGRNIQAIPLATSEADDYEPLEVSGWGNIREGGPSSCQLLTVSIQKIPDRICQQIYRTGPSQLCAGVMAGGKDSCQGDSGGPLVKLTGSSAVLYGVVSFGDGCAKPNRPGVYTKVSAYSQWIEQTMRSS